MFARLRTVRWGWRLNGLALGAALLVCPAVGRAHPASAACDLAVEIVRLQASASRGRPLVIPATVRSAASGASLSDFRKGWAKATPSDEVLAAYLEQGDRSALTACPSLVDFLKAAKIDYGDAAERARWDRERPLIAHADALYVSLPVVSADGREAIVDVGVSCGSLCGNGMLRYYRRDDAGVWTLAGSSRWWLS